MSTLDVIVSVFCFVSLLVVVILEIKRQRRLRRVREIQKFIYEAEQKAKGDMSRFYEEMQKFVDTREASDDTTA